MAPPVGQQGAGAGPGQQGGALATATGLFPQHAQPAVKSVAAPSRPAPTKRRVMFSLLWPQRTGQPEPSAGIQGSPKAGRAGPAGAQTGANAAPAAAPLLRLVHGQGRDHHPR